MKYNEFTAKKLGEVLAFCQVGIDTLEKGEIAIAEAYESSELSPAELRSTLEAQLNKIQSLAEEAGVSDITLAKAEKTGQKLTQMRDMYVGDEWDNPAELMEWAGFFEGAAVVHFALVAGVAQNLNDSQLEALGSDGVKFHHDLLHATEKAITQIGKNKSV